MLTIRPEQMAVFKQQKVERFENLMSRHLHIHFPSKYEDWGEDRVHETIHQGIKRAQNYGIRAEKDVSRFINLMMTFGRNFHKDPKLPWVETVLNDKKIGPRPSKMDVLYQEAEIHLSRIKNT